MAGQVRQRNRESGFQWTGRPDGADAGARSRSPAWDQKTKQPISGKFGISANAWLLDDFDPEAQPIKLIDGKNQW
jgi:hypothetical protein